MPDARPPAASMGLLGSYYNPAMASPPFLLIGPAACVPSPPELTAHAAGQADVNAHVNSLQLVVNVICHALRQLLPRFILAGNKLRGIHNVADSTE